MDERSTPGPERGRRSARLSRTATREAAIHYYVKTDANKRGDHVVHSEECQFLPNEDDRKALGDFA